MKHRYLIGAILLLQAVSAFFFVSQIVISVFRIPIEPIGWYYHELIEIGAGIGLILGVVTGIIAFNVARRRTQRAEAALRAASGAFLEVMEEKFDAWGLTPAERDVALFSVKGLSMAEIAELRATSEGTVKAQTAAIYRKAGVSGRSQLLSLFIDDLMAAEPGDHRLEPRAP